jgi:hypothetical protein
MKRSLLERLGEFTRSQLQNIGILNGVLNHKLDEKVLQDLSKTIQDSMRGDVLRVVKGDTDRIRALRDVALLMPQMQRYMNTTLCFSKVLTDTSYPDEGDRFSRVWKMEFIRVWLLTVRSERSVCTDFDLLASSNDLRFDLFDFSPLMLALDERQYITLQCEANIRTGAIAVNRFLCPSEEIDEPTQVRDREIGVWFDTDMIFAEVFEDTFQEHFSSDDLDLGSYRTELLRDPFVQSGRKFVIYIGTPDEHGVYAEEWYQFNQSEEGVNSIMQVEGPDKEFPLRRSVQHHEVIPYMVASLALRISDERNYLVQYDAEEKSIVITPGDPYVGTDTLAEVLPESGLGLSDGAQS